jgi:hypothetical protein
MKKIMIGLAVLCMAGLAQAVPDSKEFTSTLVGATADTNTVTIRGTLEGIFVDIAVTGTVTVTVSTPEAVLFTKAGIVADTFFTPYRAVQTSTGAAATFVGGTNDTANAWYVPQIMAGPVTITTLSQTATTTNTYTVRVLYRP